MVSAMIATSGHTLQAVCYAQYCAKATRNYEPRLDDLRYMASLYPSGQQMSAKPKFAWGSITKFSNPSLVKRA